MHGRLLLHCHHSLFYTRWLLRSDISPGRSDTSAVAATTLWWSLGGYGPASTPFASAASVTRKVADCAIVPFQGLSGFQPKRFISHRQPCRASEARLFLSGTMQPHQKTCVLRANIRQHRHLDRTECLQARKSSGSMHGMPPTI